MTETPITVDVTIELKGGRHAEIQADVWPHDPGCHTGHPDNWTPPAEGAVQVDSVYITHDEHPNRRRRLRGAALEAFVLARWDELEGLAHHEAESDNRREP